MLEAEPGPEDTQLRAEVLLAATGLLRPPDETSRMAASVLLEQLKAALLAVLEREEQTPLRVNDKTAKYHGKLAKTPQYETITAQLEESDGLAFAGAYQLAHQTARQLLLDRYPAVSMEGIFGERIYEPDPEKLAQWLLEVDTVENQRIVKDLAAAAILPETLDVFSGAFPLIYQELLKTLDDRLAELALKEWSPPPWLETAVAIFKRLPVQVTPPAPPPAAPPPSRAKLAIDRLRTSEDPTEA